MASEGIAEGQLSDPMDEEATAKAEAKAKAIAEAAATAKALSGHAQTVTGVQVDALNRHLISASLDGTIKWYAIGSNR